MAIMETNQSELKYLLTNEKRLDYLSTLVGKIGEEGNVLVLVDRVEAGKELVKRLGDKAPFISGATKALIEKNTMMKLLT